MVHIDSQGNLEICREIYHATALGKKYNDKLGGKMKEGNKNISKLPHVKGLKLNLFM